MSSAALWSFASGAALIAAAASLRGVVAARGSTAVPAAAWAVAAALALAAETAARAAGGLVDPAAAAAARLVTVALGVCPAMSLLGAKRPQHGAWQFIVAALAVVVALPAAALLARPGTMPDVDPLRRWFLVALVALGWMNFVATRRGVAATAVAVGQLLVARRFLPFADDAAVVSAAGLDAVAACLLAAGATVAAVEAAPGRPAASAAPWIDPPFLALRETLGAAWALRIAERFNAVAGERGWPCRLRFAGLDRAAAVDGPWRTDAERAFRALARRFASPAWLRRHAAPHPSMVSADATR
ncbi:MAG: hypothetical protein ACKOZU_07360 [Planctomycetaceae bacterium]